MHKPTMLVITGPQGSGNHLFSKIFSQHPDVYGWKMKEYWEGHHKEPFNKYWENTDLLSTFDWTQRKYYFTSVSCPFFRNKKPHIPNYDKFISKVSKYCNVKVLIVGRDKNILEYQQTRVRKTHTTPIAVEVFIYLSKYNPIFASQELYQLYGNFYLQNLSKLLEFPIAEQQIFNDENQKYIQPVSEYWLDQEVYKAVATS
jgi:hypothetical protein